MRAIKSIAMWIISMLAGAYLAEGAIQMYCWFSFVTGAITMGIAIRMLIHLLIEE